MPTAGLSYWALIRGEQFWRYEIAHRERPGDCGTWARAWLDAAAAAEWLEYEDADAGIYRAALVSEDRLEACVFLSPRPDLPSRRWLAQLFGKPRLEEGDRAGLLAGESPDAGGDPGPVVCACFGVGRNTICTSIREKSLDTPAGVTAVLRAGGNCGSCIPEIRRLIAEAHAGSAA